MTDTLVAAFAVLGTLALTSLYGLTATAIRKRVSIRSPESKTIDQLVPLVNALIEVQGPQMQGIIAILEAQKGQCNGNVDAALEVNRAAKKKFDEFLITSAKVEL